MPEEISKREEGKNYTAFFNAIKRALAKGAVIEITGLRPQDQIYVEACMLEVQDGAYCD
jgi:hypothetical protein